MLRNNNGKLCAKKLFVSTGVMWTLWKARNDMVFEDKLMAASEMMVYKLLALLTHWKPLLKQKETGEVEAMSSKLVQECRRLSP